MKYKNKMIKNKKRKLEKMIKLRMKYYNKFEKNEA